MAKKFCNWVKNEIELANKIVQQLQHTPNEEAMHQLRVSFKKLRAILKVTEHAASSFKTNFPLLAKLYQLTGEQRNRQMMLQKLLQLPAAPFSVKILETLSKQELQLSKNLNRLLTSNNFKPGWEKELVQLQKLLCNISSTTLKKAFEFGIKKISYGHLPYKNLHALRKKVKRIIYQHDALKYCGHKSLQKNDLKQLQALQQMLGEWHDWDIAWQWVNNQLHSTKNAALFLLQQQASTQAKSHFEAIRFWNNY